MPEGHCASLSCFCSMNNYLPEEWAWVCCLCLFEEDFKEKILFKKEKSAPSRRSLSCWRPRTRLEGQIKSKHFSSAFLETSHSKWSTGIWISFYLSLCDDDVVKLWYLILMVGEGISPCFHPFQYIMMMMKMMMRTKEDFGHFDTDIILMSSSTIW